MFWNPKTPEEVKVDDVVDTLLSQMQDRTPDSPEFADYLTYLERMDKLRNTNKRARVSPDTVVLAVCNLAGILAVLHYEKLDVITSKAMNLVIKSK